MAKGGSQVPKNSKNPVNPACPVGAKRRTGVKINKKRQKINETSTQKHVACYYLYTRLQ